jgi:hypothetical protein
VQSKQEKALQLTTCKGEIRRWSASRTKRLV